MRRIVAAAFAVAALLAAGCSMNVELAENEARTGDINMLAGHAALAAGSRLEGVINIKAGNVELGPGCAVVGGVSVGNGSIETDGDVRAPRLRVGNGAIEARAGTISGEVSVGNGAIELFGTRVAGLVSLDRGRLDAREAMLLGGLTVENKGGVLSDTTLVVLGPGCRLTGTVKLSGLVRMVIDPDTDVSAAVFTDLKPQVGWGDSPE